MVEFYSKLRGFWSELDNHVKVPHCTCNGCKCGGCKCNVVARTMAMVEVNKSYQFLLSLNDDLYSQTRGQILAMEPLPPLEKIFNIVTQEEQHKRLMVGRDDRVETTEAFAAVGRVEKPTWIHCGKYGDDEAGCFELIRYLTGWITRQRTRWMLKSWWMREQAQEKEEGLDVNRSRAIKQVGSSRPI